MTPDAIYTRLRAANAATACESSDGHVLASIFTAGVAECRSGGTLTDALGICGPALRSPIERCFPGSMELLEPFGLDSDPFVTDDEQCMRELLWRFRTSPAPLTSLLSILVARRATRPNHLWQDLGLENRGQLSALMQCHFVSLARRNDKDMKWKKFFFRLICRDEGYRMCSAPCCAECSDFANCFGDESGESLLARVRHELEAPQLASGVRVQPI